MPKGRWLITLICSAALLYLLYWQAHRGDGQPPAALHAQSPANPLPGR